MNALIQKLEGRFRRLPPFTITAIGLCWVLALGVIDYLTPGAMSFVLFYMLAVVFTGWGAGKWHAWFVSLVAALTMLTVHYYLRRGVPQSASVALWNYATRFMVFSVAGWLMAEVARLTRHLSILVEERTAQWKAEAEQHKSTSARLTEANERFEQVINNIGEVFWLSDVSKSQMLYISPGYERIWGRKCEELYGEPKSWLAAVHPADRDTVAHRAHTEQAGGTYDVEYRILRPDGSLRWIRDRAFPVRNEQGEVCRIAGLADDITERKQTQEVLQTLATILESMAEGVVVTDEQGRIVQMNPAADRIWGYERGEVLGQSADIFSALPEPEKTAAMQEVLTALRTKGSWRGRFPNRHKSGRLIYCEAFMSRVEVAGRTLYVALEQEVTERLRIQEQLQMQARVLENMAEAVLMTDEQGKILLTNPALDTLMGYERGELLGQSIGVLSVGDPEELRRVFDRLLEQIKTHGLICGERLARRKDRAVLEIQCCSSGFTLDGRFYTVIVGQDITQRKQAEQTLRQSEESLRVFLDAVPQPALLLDREGVILLVNQAASAGLSIPHNKLTGQNAFGLLTPPASQNRRAALDQVLRTRKPIRFEDEHRGRYFINFFSPVLDDAGNVSRVAVFALDITERRQAEVALARKEELYRTLFELSPDGIVVGDASGTILDANLAICQAFGYSRKELLGRNLRCLAPPDQQDEAKAYLAALRAGQTLLREVWGIRKNGDRRLISLHSKPLLLPDGRQGILAVTRDITETKRTELLKEVFLLLATELNKVDSPLAAGRAICAAADRLWQWDAAVLQLYSVERDCLDSVLLIDTIAGKRCEVSPPTPDSPPPPKMRRIMEQGAELILRTPAELQPNELVAFGDVQRLSASLMYAPLRRKGQTVGVLSIQSYTPNAFTEADLRTLEALADQCGGALERIRAEQAVREAHTALEQRVRERTAELQTANAALQESEARLQLALREQQTQLAYIESIYQTAPVGLCVLDADFRYVRINDRLASLNRLPVHQHLGRTMHEVLPHLADAAEEVFRQVITTGEPVLNFESKETTQGQADVPRVALVHWAPLKAADGQVTGVSVVIEEITERRRAERALREAHDQLEQRVRERTAELQAANAALSQSEERYRSLINNLNVGVYRNTPDPHGRFLQANPALARILGYDSVAEIERVSVADTYQDPRQRPTILADVLREGTLRSYELRLKKKDGTPIYASVNATPHYNANGEVDWFDGVLEDITQQRLAQEALRASEERYRTLAETSPDAIFILDRNIRVEFVNSAAAGLWGRQPADIIGRSQAEIFPPAIAQHQSQVVAAIFANGGVVRRDEPVPFPGGERWLETRLTPIRDAQGAVAAVMGVSRDISERKRAEQQLADALDLNRKMLAAAATGIAAFKASGECLFANEALARIPDISLARILQASFRRTESWRESGLLQTAEEVLGQGQSRSGEFFLRTRPGKSLWLNCQLNLFVSNNQPHLLVMVQDISERKQADTLLQAQSDLGLNFSLTSDLDAALKHLLDITMRIGAVDCGGVHLLNETIGGMDLVAHHGGSPAFLKAVAHWPPDSPQMQLVLQGRPVFSPYRELPFRHDEPRQNENLRATALIPLCHNGKAIGALALASTVADEIPRQTQIVFEVIAAQAAGAIARIKAENDRRRLEQQILEIGDRQQARIGHDIHDGLCQSLVSLAFDANSLHRDLAAKHHAQADRAHRIALYLDHAITEARQLSRGLFPVRLATDGLAPALEELVNATARRFRIQCRFPPPESAVVVDSTMATHLYRIAQEAVANAVKHGQARSVCIRLCNRAGQIELSVEDDGRGLSSAKPGKHGGMGLHIMDYRARAVGGTLRVGQGQRGGTLVSCCVPLSQGGQSCP